MIADRRTHKNLTTFFSDREGGVSQGDYASLNLGYFSGDERSAVNENRRRLCEVLSIPASHLVVPNEVHGCQVMVVDEPVLKLSSEERDEVVKCDGLVTTMRGVCLGVTVADCVPVLLYDEAGDVIAAAHAGWKGIVSGVLRETLATMERLGSRLENIHAEVWPSISCGKFEVGEEVVERFAEVFPAEELSQFVVREDYAKPHINLREAVRLQLISLGLSPDHIWLHGDCTYSDSRYYSARRDGYRSGRMVAGICNY